MTAVLDAPADLTGLTDDELTAMYATADDATIAALTAECDRRDREARIAAGRREASRKYEALRLEWYQDAAYPEFLKAQIYCSGGKMLSPEGERNTDEPSTLWTGSEDDAQAWALTELKTWWLDHPRTTFRAWLRQRARGLRAQRDDREGEAMETEQAPPVAARDDHAARSAARRERIDQAKARAGIGTRPAATSAVAVRQADALEGTVYSPGAVCMPPIDGAEVLNQAYGYLGHMVYWPSEALQITGTLYAAMAHGRAEKTKLPVFPYVPRLFLTSEEGGSGKSRAARIIAALCPDPERLAEMTKASLIDLIGERHTVVITEVDTLIGATGGRTPWLAGLVNVGYEDDGKTGRKQGGVVVKIPLCGVVILDGLKSVIYSTGDKFKTMRSRCIIGEMFKAPEGYQAPKFRGEAKEVAKDIQGRLARWMAQEVRDGIGEHEPILPSGLGCRPADLWEPLFSVAERAGGHWPALARFACERIETAAGLMGEEEVVADRVSGKLAAWGASGPSIAGVTDMDGDEFE